MIGKIVEDPNVNQSIQNRIMERLSQPINDVGSQIGDQVSQGISNGFNQIYHDLIMFITFLLEKILAVGAIAVICYMVIYCILYMFLGQSKAFHRILLSYFLLLVVRILNVLVVGGWNYGNSINR